MDKKEAMPLSGESSYFMHTGIHELSDIDQIASTNVSFQSTAGISLMQPTFSVNPSSEAMPRGISSIGGAPSAFTLSQPIRRKRGRPRKYGPEGAISLVLSSSLSVPSSGIRPAQKKRGRPPGSGPRQKLASHGGWHPSPAGMGFTPHVITISVGEDIAKKIMSFCGQGPRSMCVLSASGAISTAILHQPSISGGTITYEGRFEIVRLSGSYLFTDIGYTCGQSGGLSVSISSPEGRVIGGGVGGALIAATPIQVIVGSFLCGSTKAKSKAGEILERSDHQTDENTMIPTGVRPNDNLD